MQAHDPTPDPKAQRRHALARVYALLVRLAEDEESISAQDIEGEIQDPKEVKHNVQLKTDTRVFLPNPRKQRR